MQVILKSIHNIKILPTNLGFKGHLIKISVLPIAPIQLHIDTKPPSLSGIT